MACPEDWVSTLLLVIGFVLLWVKWRWRPSANHRVRPSHKWERKTICELARGQNPYRTDKLSQPASGVPAPCSCAAARLAIIIHQDSEHSFAVKEFVAHGCLP